MGTQRPILGPVSRSGGGRGHIEERKNGTFRAIVSAGIDPVTGRRRVLKETVPSRKQAKVALTRLLNQVDEQRHPRSTVTLRQVIAMWLEVAEHGRKTRQRFYAQLRRCRDITCGGRLRAGHECKALANSSIRQIHFILRPTRARRLPVLAPPGLERGTQARLSHTEVSPAGSPESPPQHPPRFTLALLGDRTTRCRRRCTHGCGSPRPWQRRLYHPPLLRGSG